MIFVAVDMICPCLVSASEHMLFKDDSHCGGEHKPVVPSQRLHNDGPAVKSTGRKYDGQNRQGYLNTEYERATRFGVHVVGCRPFYDIFYSWESGHLFCNRRTGSSSKERPVVVAQERLRSSVRSQLRGYCFI